MGQSAFSSTNSTIPPISFPLPSPHPIRTASTFPSIGRIFSFAPSEILPSSSSGRGRKVASESRTISSPNYKEINVAAQESDPNSLLNFYRKAISLRKSLKAVRFGDYKEYYPLNNKLYVYSRATEDQKILVTCSFSEKETKIKIPSGFDLSKAKLILGNYENEEKILKPYETRVYLWE
jgi:glycosidase